MILALRVFFVTVLVSMLAVTAWASGQCALWAIPRGVAAHPWFIATLFDAYWGFLAFYCWVFYKETALTSRLGWLLGILLLGNIAISIYALIQLLRVPLDARLEDVLLRRRAA